MTSAPVIYLAVGRQDGPGRDIANGRYRAVLRGAVGCYEAAMGGQRRAGVLRQIQRIPTQRLGEIVSRA